MVRLPGSDWGWAENVPEAETPYPSLSAKLWGEPRGFSTCHHEWLLYPGGPSRRGEKGLPGEGKGRSSSGAPAAGYSEALPAWRKVVYPPRDGCSGTPDTQKHSPGSAGMGVRLALLFPCVPEGKAVYFQTQVLRDTSSAFRVGLPAPTASPCIAEGSASLAGLGLCF